MIFIVFLAFFKMQIIHELKLLAWKLHDFLTDSTIKPLFIEAFIYQNSYLLNSKLTFKINLSWLQSYA